MRCCLTCSMAARPACRRPASPELLTGSIATTKFALLCRASCASRAAGRWQRHWQCNGASLARCQSETFQREHTCRSYMQIGQTCHARRIREPCCLSWEGIISRDGRLAPAGSWSVPRAPLLTAMRGECGQRCAGSTLPVVPKCECRGRLCTVASPSVLVLVACRYGAANTLDAVRPAWLLKRKRSKRRSLFLAALART